MRLFTKWSNNTVKVVSQSQEGEIADHVTLNLQQSRDFTHNNIHPRLHRVLYNVQRFGVLLTTWDCWPRIVQSPREKVDHALYKVHVRLLTTHCTKSTWDCWPRIVQSPRETLDHALYKIHVRLLTTHCTKSTTVASYWPRDTTDHELYKSLTVASYWPRGIIGHALYKVHVSLLTTHCTKPTTVASYWPRDTIGHALYKVHVSLLTTHYTTSTTVASYWPQEPSLREL